MKILVIVIVGLLVGSTAYGLYYFYGGTTDNTDHDHGNNETDTEPPTITDVTGDTTVVAGQTITISAQFSDNVGVTEATLYYRPADASSWTNDSILSGYATISIPSTAIQNYYYYVIVNDAAGNGPVGDPSTDGSIYYTITVQPAGGPDNENFTHAVFIEEATATWCTNCPNLANILSTLYESHKYNFYYTALINDTNQVTNERLWKDYNVYGFPTAYFDGGYKVIVGGGNPTSLYTDAFNASLARTVPKIRLTVTTQYKNTTQEVTVTTRLENKENNTYTGRLKLYLTEIISRYDDYEGKPYHFGLVDYVNDTNVSVDGNSEVTFSDTKNISAYDFENLMVIGVVFNSGNHTGYSFPPSGNPFNAYYADATNASRVSPQGNLPPQLQITSPLKGKVYLNGKQMPIFDKVIHRKFHLIKKLQNFSFLETFFLYNRTFLFGKKVITVNATDDSAVAKVEFYIDGVLRYNTTKAPYEFSFTDKLLQKRFFGRNHTLKVIVYDDEGKTASASLVFRAHFK